jgi:hypothetical protein
MLKTPRSTKRSMAYAAGVETDGNLANEIVLHSKFYCHRHALDRSGSDTPSSHC